MKYTSIVLYKFVENILNYYYENSVGTIPAMLIFDISIRCIIIRIIIYIYIYMPSTKLQTDFHTHTERLISKVNTSVGK